MLGLLKTKCVVKYTNNNSQHVQWLTKNPTVKPPLRFSTSQPSGTLGSGDDVWSSYVKNQQMLKENSGVIWISNTYTLGRYMNLVRLYYKLRGKEKEFQEKLHKEIDDSFDDLQFPKIRQIIPCLKESGCYIVFASKDQAKQVLQALGGKVLIAGHSRSAYLVQGKPFIEDLAKKLPSRKLIIDLVDSTKSQTKLTTELLFNEMRLYGRMEDVIIDQKNNTANVIFSNINSAISARNCLHLKSIGDSQFYARYDYVSLWQQIRDILTNAKIMIPLLGLIITLSLYLLVDPTRIASITTRLTRGFQDEDEVKEEEVAQLREELMEEMKHHFRTLPFSSILLTGPSGAGKSYLLRQILQKRAFTIRIDCKGITSAQEFIEHFGECIGFSPSFNTLNTVLTWLESLIPGLKKAALSPTAKAQLESMLSCLDNVLFLISASYPTTKEWDFPVIVFDGFYELVDTLYTSEDKDKANVLVDLLIGWAAKHANRAHFVFSGDNFFGEEIVRQNRHMKAGVVKTYKVNDLSFEQSMRFINIFTKQSKEDVEYAYSKLGGRLSELQSLVAKVKSGKPIRVCVDDIVNQAEQNVRNESFGGKYFGATSKKWTQVHLWKAIKKVVAQKTPAYDDVLFGAFGGDSEALKAVIKSNILCVQRNEAGEREITAFSPLYQTVFSKMVNETPALRKNLDLLEKKAEINKDMDELVKVEEELMKLKDSESREQSIEAIFNRRAALNEKMAFINKKIEKKELEARIIESR